MKKFFLLFLSTLFFFTACEEEDENPISALPQLYRGNELFSIAYRTSGTQAWVESHYITIFISDDGRYYTMYQGEPSDPDRDRHEGSINWREEDGVQKVDFVGDDQSEVYEFTVLRNDENRLALQIDWGGELREWFFITGKNNLKGLVYDQQGNSIRGAQVVFYSQNGTIGSVSTDEDGYFGVNRQTFGFAGLEDASRLVVYKSGYSDEEREVARLGNSYNIQMSEGDSGLNFGTVYGYVTAKETGDPVSMVAISSKSAEDTAYTNNNGYYEMLVPVSVNSITATHDGYRDNSKSVTVESLGEVQVDFELETSGHQLSGNVFVSGSSDIQGVELTCEDSQGTIIESLKSDSDGSFSFENLEDGTYLISASYSGMQFVPSEQLVNISDGNVSNVVFLGVAEGVTAMGGQVTHWDDGNPVADATVTCGNSSKTTNAGGYYLMEVQETGNPIVVAEKTGFMNRYEEVSITDGELSLNNMQLAPPSSGVSYTLEGTVYDNSSNSPLENALISVINSNEAKSNANGRYSIVINVYDESQQYIEVDCEKTGYIKKSSFFYISTQVSSQYDFYLVPE